MWIKIIKENCQMKLQKELHFHKKICLHKHPTDHSWLKVREIRPFAWLVVYQGLPTKARQAKSNFVELCLWTLWETGDSKAPFLETVKLRGLWWKRHGAVQISAYVVQTLHWRTAILGDYKILVQNHLLDVWHCVKMVCLNVLQKQMQ